MIVRVFQYWVVFKSIAQDLKWYSSAPIIMHFNLTKKLSKKRLKKDYLPYNIYAVCIIANFVIIIVVLLCMKGHSYQFIMSIIFIPCII